MQELLDRGGFTYAGSSAMPVAYVWIKMSKQIVSERSQVSEDVY